MPDLAKKISEYKQQPDPLVQKQKELEIAKLQSEINERNSRVYENQVDSRLKSAKAVNEEAKARKSHSEADMTDLDFLRKQEGVDRREKVDDDLIKANVDMQKQDQNAALDFVKQAELMAEGDQYNKDKQSGSGDNKKTK
jgi:hypothetical protein